MCFNLNSGVVVTRRTITPLPMLDRIMKLINIWVNQPRDRKYTDGIKFLDHKKNEFKWESEDLGETIDDVDDPIYPTLAAEILGVVIEDDYVNEGAALEDPTPPNHREHAASASSKANITTTPGVVPPVPPENTTNRTLIAKPRLFIPEIEEDPEEEDDGIEEVPPPNPSLVPSMMTVIIWMKMKIH